MAVPYSIILPTATSHGTVSSSSFADALANFSVSLWFKTTESIDYHHIVGKLDDAVGNGGWTLQIAMGQLFFSFWTPSHGAQYSGYTVNTVNDGLWHNLLMTYDLVLGVTIYVDGTLQTLTGVAGTPPGTNYTTSVYFGFGNTASDINSSCAGNIAYAQFWNTTLSDSDAASVASNGDISSGLVAKWQFLDGPGTIVADSVGNNTLTFSAVAWSLDVPPVLTTAIATALTQIANFPVVQPVSDANINKNFGIWSYYAGASGTVTVTAGQRVIGIECQATIAGSFTIDGGATIPIPANSNISIEPLGNIVAPVIVFTNTDSYFVAVVS